MLRETSSDSVRIIYLDRDEVLAALRRIAARIRAAHPEVLDVRAFGSIARGDQTGVSDADVLIVLRDRPADPLESVRFFYRYFDLPLGADLLVLDEEGLIRRRQAGDPFICRIWGESLPL